MVNSGIGIFVCRYRVAPRNVGKRIALRSGIFIFYEFFSVPGDLENVIACVKSRSLNGCRDNFKAAVVIKVAHGVADRVKTVKVGYPDVLVLADQF